MTSSSLPRAGRLAAVSAALLGAALLAGCGTSVKLDGPAPVESRDTRTPAAEAASRSAGVGAGTAGVGSTAVTTVQAGGVGALGGAAGAAAAATASGRVIYFDFDSFTIKEEFRPVIEAHGRRLINERQRQMLVEGHTDERGGREYNLALGQRRAEAVVRALVLVGARDSQVEAVSLGEERPAATGSDEAAWAKNRRAELKDK